MANGFWLNDAACRWIGAERRVMRHLSNSLAASQPNSARRARVFFATPDYA